MVTQPEPVPRSSSPIVRPVDGIAHAVRAVLRAIRRSAFGAAALSGLIPGLGQVWVGSIRRGILISAPIAIGAIAAGWVLFASDRLAIAGALLSPDVLVALLIANGVLLLYRGAAIVDAFRLAHRRWGRPGRIARAASMAGLAVLLAVTTLEHAAPAYLAGETYDVVTSVFVQGDQAGDTEVLPDDDFGDASPAPVVSPRMPASAAASPTGSSLAPTSTPAASLSPTPTESASPAPAAGLPKWAQDGRLNLLLIGTDAGPDRWKLRTDTMILVSVDVRSGRAALFGIPRNMINVPLPPESAGAFACRCFPGLLNALWVYADGHPSKFPGDDRRGFRAVAGAIHELTGARIDGMAVVDLNGFVELIDALGGLRIRVPEPLVDHNYPKPDGSGLIELRIAAGLQTMNGFTALAYARSRHQDSDYGRMRRQQEVLLALGAQLKPCRVIDRLPTLLPIVKRLLWTTIRTSDLPGLLQLAGRVDVRKIERVMFTPSRYSSHVTAEEVSRIRKVVANIFGQPANPTPLEELPEGPC